MTGAQCHNSPTPEIRVMERNLFRHIRLARIGGTDDSSADKDVGRQGVANGRANWFSHSGKPSVSL